MSYSIKDRIRIYSIMRDILLEAEKNDCIGYCACCLRIHWNFKEYRGLYGSKIETQLPELWATKDLHENGGSYSTAYRHHPACHLFLINILNGIIINLRKQLTLWDKLCNWFHPFLYKSNIH